MLTARKTSLLFILTVFFFLAIFAALLFWTTEQWQKSSDLAALSQTEEVVKNFYALQENKASESLDNLIQTRYLQQSKNEKELRNRLDRYLESGAIIGAEITGPGGILLDNIGGPGVFSKKLSLKQKGEEKIIRLEKTSATVFLNELRSLSGQEFSLYRDQQVLASTIPGENLPRDKTLSAEEGLSTANIRLGDLDLVSGVYKEEVFVANTQIIIPTLLFFFFVILLAMLILMRRSSKRELQGVLKSIDNLSRGQKEEQEKSGSFREVNLLYQAVNKMGQEVDLLVSSLRNAKERLEKVIQKSGDVFAMGPSEEETLRLLLDLALSSTEARSGLTENNQNGERYMRADPDEAAPLLRLLKESERAGMIEKEDSESFLLATPLFAFETVIGGLALNKREPFSENEKETIRYLTSQAQVALENSALHARLKKEAATDDLTKLANRRTMRQTLEKEFARSTRFQRPLSLLLIDIDNFKAINDTYGHSEGDLVLQEIAQTIQKTLRHIDLVARWGGEEFLVLLPETEKDEAIRTAERIQQMIRNTSPSLDKKITASIGVAAYPEDGGSSTDMILLADQAMYRAKNSGKDCVATTKD